MVDIAVDPWRAPICVPTTCRIDRNLGDGGRRDASTRTRLLYGKNCDRPGYPQGTIDLDASTEENIRKIGRRVPTFAPGIKRCIKLTATGS